MTDSVFVATLPPAGLLFVIVRGTNLAGGGGGAGSKLVKTRAQIAALHTCADRQFSHLPRARSTFSAIHYEFALIPRVLYNCPATTPIPPPRTTHAFTAVIMVEHAHARHAHVITLYTFARRAILHLPARILLVPVYPFPPPPTHPHPPHRAFSPRRSFAVSPHAFSHTAPLPTLHCYARTSSLVHGSVLWNGSTWDHYVLAAGYLSPAHAQRRNVVHGLDRLPFRACHALGCLGLHTIVTAHPLPFPSPRTARHDTVGFRIWFVTLPTRLRMFFWIYRGWTFMVYTFTYVLHTVAYCVCPSDF